MKNIKYLLFINSLAITNFVYARTIDGSVQKLTSIIQKLAYSFGFIGVLFAGIAFVLGKQDASAKATSSIIGLFIIATSAAIIQTAKSLG